MIRFEDRFVQVGGRRTRYWQGGKDAAGEGGKDAAGEGGKGAAGEGGKGAAGEGGKGAAGERGKAATTEQPPLVLLHGIGCSVTEWGPTLRGLGARRRVIALDMLGSGATDKPADGDYSIRGLARFVLDFATALGLGRMHLGGNSLGGRVAIEAACVEPARVASMVLADPAGVGRETFINFRLATLPLLGELLTKPNRAGLAMLWRKAYHDPSRLEPERIDAKLADAQAPGAQTAFLATLRGFLAFGGFPKEQLAALHAALPLLRQPTLIVWGAQDHLLPVAQGRALQAMLPTAELLVVDRCGHLPQLEAADRFEAAVEGFLARVEAQRGMGSPAPAHAHSR